MSIEPQDELRIQLSVNYFVNPKVIGLSGQAQLADIKAMCFLKRAGIDDGVVTPEMWLMMNGDDMSLIDELVEVARWEVVAPKGWRVRGWEDWFKLDTKPAKRRKSTGQLRLATAEELLPEPKKWTTVDVEAVFDCWVETLPAGATRKLSSQRRRKIEARLNEGYSIEELCKAVKGWQNDPWPDRRIHNDVVQLLRSGDSTERMIGFFDHPPRSGDAAASFNAIDEVLG